MWEDVFRGIEKFSDLLILWELLAFLFLSVFCESTLLLAYNILSKLKSGRLSWYFWNDKESATWCRIFLWCFSQSKGDTEKIPSSKKSFPRNTGPTMRFILLPRRQPRKGMSFCEVLNKERDNSVIFRELTA